LALLGNRNGSCLCGKGVAPCPESPRYPYPEGGSTAGKGGMRECRSCLQSCPLFWNSTYYPSPGAATHDSCASRTKERATLRGESCPSCTAERAQFEVPRMPFPAYARHPFVIRQNPLANDSTAPWARQGSTPGRGFSSRVGGVAKWLGRPFDGRTANHMVLSCQRSREGSC
jgi:hypothetical protein